MFDGKSKTRYVGSGKQKDTSKAKLLSDAREKREKRAMDKKRTEGAVVIQTIWRRHEASRKVTQAVLSQLREHLATIKTTDSMTEFNVPLDTLFTLMRCSIFLIPRAEEDTEIMTSFQEVLNLIVIASKHANNSFSLFHLANIVDDEVLRNRWQVLVSDFFSIAFQMSRNILISANKSDSTVKQFENGSDCTLVRTSSLIHSLVVLIDTSTGRVADIVLGTIRAVAVSLCGLLRDVCNVNTTSSNSEVSDRNSGLSTDIAIVLKYALKEYKVDGKALGTTVVAHKYLWHIFSLDLLSIPRVWSHTQLCPLLENVLGLQVQGGESQVSEEYRGQQPKEDSLSPAMVVWRNILFSGSSSASIFLRGVNCGSRLPFAVLSKMIFTIESHSEMKESLDKNTVSPSFLLVNNFFEYAIHRDSSLLNYSSHSTHYWVDMLSHALNQRNVPLIAAINQYHGVIDKQFDVKTSSEGVDHDSDSDDNDDSKIGDGSKVSIGTRDVVNTILEDSVSQTRSRLLRKSVNYSFATSSAKASHIVQYPVQESKRPRLQQSHDTGSNKSLAYFDAPSLDDTVELLNYLSNSRVLSAMAEHCAACLAHDGIGDMNELLHLLSVLLIYSPAGTNFSSPTKRSSLASQILGVFSFGRTSQILVEGLWQSVKVYIQEHPSDYVHRFVLPNVSAVSTSAPPRSLFTPTAPCVPPEEVPVTNFENASLLVLLCILSHQLLAIDDEEFSEGSKALKSNDICDLVVQLKTLMFQMYWTDPVLTKHENEFDDAHRVSSADLKPDERQKELTFLRIHLNNLQLMFISTKVFNQLSVRNERIHFLSPGGWLWTSLINSELDGLNVDANPFQDPKATRARMVLLLCPQVIPFNQRAVYFQRLLRNDKAKIRNPQEMHYFSSLRVNIHRAALFDSTFETLSRRSTAEWKKNIQVVFTNEQGVEESGIDGGGLFKEFVDILLKDMFSTPQQQSPPPLHRGNSLTNDHNASLQQRNMSDVFDLTDGGISSNDAQNREYRKLFLTTATGMLVPNPTALLDPNNIRGTLEQYLFMGKMLGKAVYEEILVEPQFAGMFLNHLLGRTNFIDDLVTLDQEIYHSLLKLKRDYLHGDRNIEELELTFEVDIVTPTGQTISRELIPGGSAVPVTKSNLVSYLYLYANFKLNVETHRQSLAFLQGFRELIPTEWMRMFNTSELQLVIGGDNEKGIDLPSLQRLCTYSGGYHPSQPYIQAFWEIMESLSPADQGEFLRFVTSCSRPPLLGYGQFNPPFNIMKISQEGGGEAGSKRLPMAASCFNQFKLPQYDTVEELREKLLYSIQSKSGFELS